MGYKNFKNAVTKGAARNSPSNLSRKPPWPGIVAAESFMLRLRLNNDSTRSPNVDDMIIIKDKAIHCHNSRSLK